MAEHTTRDVYALAEQLGNLTGRDAYSVAVWASREARSTVPDKVYPVLNKVRLAFVNGELLPDDFPAAVRHEKAAVGLYAESETEAWM